MPLADDHDVVKQLGRELKPSEEDSVWGKLDSASDLVAGFTHCTFGWDVDADYDTSGGEMTVPDSVPGPVRRRVALMVARVYDRESAGGPSASGFIEQVQTGPFMQRFSTGTSGGEPWLSDKDKTALARYVKQGGMGTIQLGGEAVPRPQKHFRGYL